MLSAACFGLEGLIRWQHPKYGALATRSFFQMVSDLGLRRKIDCLVFERSTNALASLPGGGLVLAELSLKLPIERLMDDDFLAVVTNRIRRTYKMTFKMVEPTISNSSLEEAHWSVGLLKDAGVGLALYGFGSADASIATMLDLASARAKLDKCLTDGIAASDSIASMVRSITDMAHALDVEVVAKDV